jgi:ABC-type transporter Mla MlaB component
MKFFLIVAKGSKKGMPIPITVDLFLMGSDRMCQLRAKNFPPELCALLTRENKVYVSDMGSGESVLVNGTVVPAGSEWPLHAGDHLEVGHLEFIIQFHEKSLSQKDMEEWAASCLDHDKEQKIQHEEEDDYHTPTPHSAAEAAASMLEKLSAQRGLIKGRLRIGLDKGITSVRFNDNKLVEDSEIAYIKKELCDNLHRPNLRVLLDCKNMERLSTAAVVMLRDFNRWLKNQGSTLAVCRIPYNLQGILPALEEDNIVIFRDKKAALAQKW